MTEHRPDVSLVSIPLPRMSPSDLLKTALGRNREERVIMMIDQVDIHLVNRLLKAGAIGCITNNIEKKKLRQIIIKAAAGERVFSSNISSLITGNYVDLLSSRTAEGERRQLTDREREILELIVEGYTSQEIAETLFISPRTVETHRSNLLQKLKIRNTAGLVRYALEELKSRDDE